MKLLNVPPDPCRHKLAVDSGNVCQYRDFCGFCLCGNTIVSICLVATTLMSTE